MPIIQENDKKRDPYKHTLYRGQGFVGTKKGYAPNKSIPKAYLSHEGGFLNFLPTLVSAANFLKDNKDLIQAGASTIGKVVDLGKSISDTVKVSKDIEKVRELREINKEKNKKKEYIMTPEQEARLRSIGKEGSGFANFSRK